MVTDWEIPKKNSHDGESSISIKNMKIAFGMPMVLPIYGKILSEQLFCRLKFISIDLILLPWLRIYFYDIKMLLKSVCICTLPLFFSTLNIFQACSQLKYVYISYIIMLYANRIHSVIIKTSRHDTTWHDVIRGDVEKPPLREMCLSAISHLILIVAYRLIYVFICFHGQGFQQK